MRTAALVSLALCPAVLAAPARAADCPGADLEPDARNLAKVRSATLCLLNAERASRGLPRLRAHRRLRRAAARHSRAMNARNFFDHSSPSGSTPLARVKAAGYLRGASTYSVGENIAWGESYLSTSREIVDSWMKSPGHRANILRRRFRHIGIGIDVGAPLAGGTGATYTTNFGSRK